MLAVAAGAIARSSVKHEDGLERMLVQAMEGWLPEED